ncbi:ubiquinone biosynthesis accessory factor UbiJ [Legionella waltersii]|uniref:Ubiquinone biosynthesis accessory factor UbiJ n=1 Tax=Legionella waltersii TaxID=66969 RepID=A0A0W1A559_9GAMM|nr:SCP2 sterol-binding domain-containing protein [Legionella waltersii]KTD76409.1 SCP-2 sterol transfer family protein [Legionella waltersii]SNV14301.1 Protein YigP [Legionella waltersii]
MLKKYSLKALEIAINQTLSLDENMPEKLQQLNEKVIEMVVSPLNVRFYIHFHHGKLLLLDEFDGSANTTIHSNPLGLIRLSVLPASKARSLFNDKIRMSGDIELGQAVKKLFDEIDIDWEGHLAQFTGDVVAHQIGSFLRRGWEFQKKLTQSMQQNVTEYLQEELRAFPPRNELVDFYNDVDELAMQVERLDAQVSWFRKQHEKN